MIVSREEHDRIGETFVGHAMNEGTKLTDAVPHYALGNDDHFRMVVQAFNRIVVEGRAGEEQEFQVRLIGTDLRQHSERETRIGAGFLPPGCSINNVSACR